MHQRFVDEVKSDTVNRNFAEKFYADCPRFEKCLEQKYTPRKVKYGECCLTGDLTFEDFLQTTCRLTEILAGPLGTCFDHIKFGHNKTELITCFLDRRPLKKFTRKEGNEVWRSGCDPTVNSCVEEIIQKDCDPEAYQVYQSKQRTLISTGCVGSQMFTQRDYYKYIDYHGGEK